MSASRELTERLAERLNAGDIDGWLDLFAADVVFLASESWPESSPVTGRDGMRQFWHEFSGVWEDVQLEIAKVHEADDAVVCECRWVTRGRASGVEGTLEFVLALWIEDQSVVRAQFFDELSDALDAVGLGN